jgi:lipoprotein-anchoring transpeptidase ErfK/SrfK
MRSPRTLGGGTIAGSMRTFPLGVVNLALIVVISGSTLAAFGSGRESSFKAEAATLEQRWTSMKTEGVPAAAIDTLEATLRHSTYEASWWSPTWWNDPGSTFIQSLEAATTATWNHAMAGARLTAASAVASWDLMAEEQAAVLPASSRAAFAQWQSRLATAATPVAITTLSAELVATTSAERRAGAQREESLVTGIPTELRTLMLMTNQAGAEGIAAAAGFIATYRQIAHAVAAKPAGSALAGLGVALASLEAKVSASLTSNACGHRVPSGKAIVINLNLQEVVFYQDGCALQAAPVTSGRNGERTPTGAFHVFRKLAPVLFTSWAPRSSPFWYAPERANYALEFTVVRAGIYLHDAPWEPSGAYGQGSQNTGDASHGCVHAPTSVMSWAYTWAPIGTPVIVTE